MEKTAVEIAELIGGNLLGDENIVVCSAASLEFAEKKDIAFAVEPHIAAAEQSQAGLVIIPDTVQSFAKPAIQVSNPREAFTKILELFAPKVDIPRGIHPTAVLGRNVSVGENVAIMPYAVLDDNVVIGDNVVVYPHVYIGQHAAIGEDSIIYASATIREYCCIGKRVIIHSGAVIGSDGFGFVTTDGRHAKVPQVGNVILGDDVEIGAHVGIDRATIDSTVVKQGTKIDNLVHLGHNVIIGENGLIVAQTGISGSTVVGKNVTFAGQCGSAGHIKVGDHCVFAARSGLISDVPASSFYGGFPARPHKEWLRGEAANKKVPDLIKKIKELEKRLQELELQQK